MAEKIFTIKERILQLLESKGVVKDKFFNKIGVSYGNFKGKSLKSGLNSDTIAEISAIFPDVNLEWLLTGKGSMIKSESHPSGGIPLIPAEAIAGKQPGELVIRDADIEERYVVPDFAKADFLIRVKGDSMEPSYLHGDIVACKHIHHHSDFIQWNKVYVIDTTQGILVKRILKGSNGTWLLRSDNKDYQDIEVNPAKDIHHINLVLGVIRLE
jgi:hypothetical protein